YESPGIDDEAAYTPANLGAVVADLVAELGPRPVVLLGHSFGGLVARGAVLAGARVAGLTLMDSGPGQLPDGGRRAALG
ncbi:alpha/beta fold hydrolase, partial [Amycolatopsis magusensis]